MSLHRIALVTALAVGFARAAHAEEAPAAPGVDVAVLAPAAADRVLVEAATRTRLELGSIGLTSVLVDETGDELPARVAFVRDDGVATIDLVGTLPDGTPLHRRVPVPAAEGGDDATVLALRAVELLRGIRLGVRRAPRPAPAPSTPDTPDADLVEAPPSEPPEWRVALGPGVLEGRPWGSSLAVGAALGLAARVLPNVSFVVTFAGPFVNGLPATPAGTAHTREELGFFGLRVDGGRTRTGVHALFGAGLHHLVASYDDHGAAAVPVQLHVRSSPSLWTPFVALGAGFGGRVWRRVGASLDVVAIVAQPAVDVVVDNRVVGSLGAPSLLETLTAWIPFP